MTVNSDQEDERLPEGPPDYDQAAVSRIASRVEIVDVELVGSHYERQDDGIEVSALPRELVPEFRIGLEWGLADGHLVVVLTFATAFDDDEQPYSIVGRFRITYLIDGDEAVSEADVEQFAHWNAMFNAWPYWREFVSSTINRGHLPRFVVPVMGVPAVRPPEDASSPADED